MKAVGTKDKKKGAKKGLKPKQRSLATQPPKHTVRKKLTANQWQNTPQQNLFMNYWLNPASETFSNAYRSALKAGYTEYYSVKITSTKSAHKWISEYVRSNIMDSEHVRQGIQEIAISARNSKSPDDTRLKAYELLGKATGFLNDKPQVNVTVVQPILGGQSVPKTIIDADPS